MPTSLAISRRLAAWKPCLAMTRTAASRMALSVSSPVDVAGMGLRSPAGCWFQTNRLSRLTVRRILVDALGSHVAHCSAHPSAGCGQVDELSLVLRQQALHGKSTFAFEG